MRSTIAWSVPAFVALGALVSCAFGAEPQQIPLSNGVQSVAELPSLGFGTWNLKKSNASDVVAAAFAAGYRHIDCAAIYGNEKEVGEGIKRGMKSEKLKREDFWVTSKLWNNMHDPKSVPEALNRTLTDLGLDYVDLYLMHWPVASTTAPDGTKKNSISYLPTWQAMTKLTTPSVRDPKAPALRIGVSNFSPAEITTLLPIHKPYAHQYESHPYLPQSGFLAFHKTAGIKVTAYSPLGNSNPTYTGSAAKALPPLLENPHLTSIASKRGCTPAQVALKWGMARGTAVIPKSAHRARIEENHAAEGCALRDEDFTELDSLPVHRFNNPAASWGVPLYGGLEDAGESEGMRGRALRWRADAVVAWRGLVEWTMARIQ